MPRLSAESLLNIGSQLFEAAGCSPSDARAVAAHLVDSSLYGHHSHGVIRFYEYVAQIKQGIFDPRGKPQVVDEKPCTAVIDGGGILGQVSAEFATRIAIKKAQQHGTGTVTLHNTSHIGRVGAYPLLIAEEQMIGIVFCNAGRLGRQIAPHGGLDPKMSTNPIAFAAPRRNQDPILVDMATSVTAEGKLRVARNRGEQVPLGWLIDQHGNPTTDPNAYYENGAILPLGGVAGYKGQCLSFMVELLGGALSGQGVSNGEKIMKSNGVLITVYRIEHFTSLDAYYNEVEILARHVQSSRVDPKIGEILLPGEWEFRNARHQRRDGVMIDETTWSQICEAGTGLGIDTRIWVEMALNA